LFSIDSRCLRGIDSRNNHEVYLFQGTIYKNEERSHDEYRKGDWEQTLRSMA
jgi:hypothetical protein